MIKKIASLAVLLGCIVNSLFCEILNPIPHEFTLKERSFSWSTDFDIETKEYKLGYVHRKIFSWFAIEYEIYNIHNQIEAKSKGRWLNWGAAFDVVDSTNIPLGSVEEGTFVFYPTFDLVSPKGEIFLTGKMNFWGTCYFLKDPITKLVLATMRRPYFYRNNTWTIKIENNELFYQKQIDSRLFIMALMFAAETDKKRKIESKKTFNQYQNDISENYSINNDLMIREKYGINDTNELKNRLEQRKELFILSEPKEDDFIAVEKMSEELLNSIFFQEGENCETSHFVSIWEVFLTLFESNHLTNEQKSALYMLMEHRLNQ